MHIYRVTTVCNRCILYGPVTSYCSSLLLVHASGTECGCVNVWIFLNAYANTKTSYVLCCHTIKSAPTSDVSTCETYSATRQCSDSTLLSELIGARMMSWNRFIPVNEIVRLTINFKLFQFFFCFNVIKMLSVWNGINTLALVDALSSVMCR